MRALHRAIHLAQVQQHLIKTGVRMVQCWQVFKSSTRAETLTVDTVITAEHALTSM